MDLKRFRRIFPVTKKTVYLDHAANDPCSTPVLKAIERFLSEWSNQGIDWMRWYNYVSRAKNLFSKLIHADPDEIAMVPNTSTGVSLAAEIAVAGRKGNIVLNDLEFPANVYPWLAKEKQGITVRYVKSKKGVVSTEDFERCIDENTIAVPLSHVSYANGLKFDVESIAERVHKRDGLMVVDAIQSAGAIEIDVNKQGIDILTCGCSKWILGPHGTGFLFVNRRLLETSQPLLIGWHSIHDPFGFNLRPLRLSRTATRFEPGNPNFLGFAGARAALELLLNIGQRRIEKEILRLTGYLIDEVNRLGLKLTTPVDPYQRAGIVNFKVRNLSTTINRLRKNRIAVSSRGGGIRVSPHFYNTIEELDSLLSVLRTK